VPVRGRYPSGTGCGRGKPFSLLPCRAVGGNKIQHAVYVFRLVATEEEFRAVYEVLNFKFPDKAPRSIECRPYWTPAQAMDEMVRESERLGLYEGPSPDTRGR